MSRRVVLPFVGGVLLAVGGFLLLGLTGRPLPAQKPEPPFEVPVGPTVRDLGAKGDGVTDDWAAIESAVNVGNGSAIFPHGTYRITKTVTVNLNKAGFTTLRG